MCVCGVGVNGVGGRRKGRVASGEGRDARTGRGGAAVARRGTARGDVPPRAARRSRGWRGEGRRMRPRWLGRQRVRQQRLCDGEARRAAWPRASLRVTQRGVRGSRPSQSASTTRPGQARNWQQRASALWRRGGASPSSTGAWRHAERAARLSGEPRPACRQARRRWRGRGRRAWSREVWRRARRRSLGESLPGRGRRYQK